MSIIGPHLEGARILDLFAGTGALGLEALSRGAVEVHFVESSPASLAALRRNVEALGVSDRSHILRGNAMTFLGKLGHEHYDLALADPPYATDYAERVVRAFRQQPFARMLAVEHASTVTIAGDDTRRYGDTSITFCHGP
jgi:16S rRNA (guanine966-N2)-methyltransferase